MSRPRRRQLLRVPDLRVEGRAHQARLIPRLRGRQLRFRAPERRAEVEDARRFECQDLKDVGVATGDKVKSGTVLGMMGETGSLHGPRLYLEVRHEGRAIDPTPWFR